ncbi:MAG: MGMT family protein [Melioribacter sp.]|nr:MGMT family protein [Melioribacter sp.]
MFKKKKIDKKDFFDKVYKIVSKIPKGKVTTYGALQKHVELNLLQEQLAGL